MPGFSFIHLWQPWWCRCIQCIQCIACRGAIGISCDRIRWIQGQFNANLCKMLSNSVKESFFIFILWIFLQSLQIFFSQAPIFLLTEAASVWVETWNGNPRPLQAYVFVAYICDMSCAYYVMCNYHCEASIFLSTFCGASKLSSCSACRNHYPQKILKSEIHFWEKPTTNRPFVSSRMRSNEKPWTYYPQSPIHDLRSESKFVSNRFPIKSAISLWQSTWCFDRF